MNYYSKKSYFIILFPAALYTSSVLIALDVGFFGTSIDHIINYIMILLNTYMTYTFIPYIFRKEPVLILENDHLIYHSFRKSYEVFYDDISDIKKLRNDEAPSNDQITRIIIKKTNYPHSISIFASWINGKGETIYNEIKKRVHLS